MIFSLVIAAGVYFALTMNFWKKYGWNFINISLIDWLVLSLIITVFGTFGDLVESLFKRGLGVKDSGQILPGHGGILDRFDSLIFSTPFVFSYMKLFT